MEPSSDAKEDHMVDPTTILVDNLRDALSHISTYLALGLATAVSAFVLDRQASDQGALTQVPIAGFVPMTPETAKMVLLGICFVAGIMAYFAAGGAIRIALRLEKTPEILSAACTYSSVATTPVGVRIIAAGMPVAFAAPILWRTWLRIRAVAPEERGGFIALLGFFLVPYGALGAAMVRLACRA